MNLLILGANSDLAQAVARKFAKEEKANLYLASRDMEILPKRAQDIAIRYEVQAQALYFDATDYDSHVEFYGSLDGKPDGVVVAFGYLGDQKKAQADFQEARKIIETNFFGAVSILEIIAADFEKRRQGFIIGISSVAGERGRQSNYIYGSAKGALNVYLSGLRNRLYKMNIPVVTVLPGYVRTKMTEHLKLPPLLVSSPMQMASDIYSGYKRGNSIIIKWYWRIIVAVLKLLPEGLFKKTML
jgi:decaprenylphospho-beta-D-erythro-pentofuranosid-2-ulose 2-reductase